MKHFFYKLFITILSFAFSVCITAKNDFVRITTDDGLSNRRVFSAAKDSKGFIWFTTRTGVDRYDGESFSHYRLSINEKVRGIITDRNKNIYAFTEKNIYRYDRAGDAFKPILNYEAIGYKTHHMTINNVYFDSHNLMWLGLSNGLIYTADMIKWSEVADLKDKSIFTFSNNSNNDFWIGTSKGIYQIKKESKSKYSLLKNSEFHLFENLRIQSLYYDQLTDNLWIGSFSNGLYAYNTIRKQLHKISKSDLSTSPIRTITSVSDKELWVGIDGQGIEVYDRTNNNYIKTYTQDSEDGHLSSNGIYHILKDNTNIWVCTYTSGVLLHNTNTIVHRYYAGTNKKDNLISNNHINALLQDSDGDIWFGTNNGLNIYNPHTKTWNSFWSRDKKEKLDNSVILSIFEDQDKNIWVGGYATDLFQINKRSGSIKKINLPNTKDFYTSKNYIYSIYQDNHGFIWLGGLLDNLVKYDPITQSFNQYEIKGINKILGLNNDTLLLGTVKGLFLLEKQTGKSHHVNLGNTALPSGVFINNLVQDINNPNLIWIGTEGYGLYQYNISTSEIKSYTMNNGLSSNYIYGIQFDKYNRLWISTEDGLNCLDPDKNCISSFFELDGLPNNSFNFLSYCKLKNGNMLWGTPDGAIEIIPEDLVRNEKRNFNLRFMAFNLFYEKIVADSTESSPLKTAIDDTETIHLAYSQHSFSFDFINVSYPAMKNVQYSWMLEGFDSNWNQPSSEHKAIYTNVPPGKYTFWVKAISLDGNQESQVRKIDIIVSPPFWASPIAYVVYLIILLNMLYFIVVFYKNRIEKQNSDEKIRFFVNMAHDIRLPITLIKAPLNELEQEELSEDGKTALLLAKKNTQKLFNLVTQLLDFQKMALDSVSLQIEKVEINSFLKNIVNNFVLLAKEKNISLQLQLSSEINYVWIDKNKLTIIIDNLLSNAVKYTPGNGNIIVKSSISDTELVVEIIDDGIGIPSKAQKNLFSRFYRAENVINSSEVGSGIGLLLTKKLVALHKGKISFDSTEGCGTSFKVEIPVSKEKYSESEIIENITIKNRVDTTDELDDNKLKILFVEDNDELRRYLSKYLSKNYKIEEAHNGKEALDLIRLDAPDFIISDILMPELSGTELCMQLKSNIETCHIPFILLTSLSERDDVIKGLNTGADDYITKPFDLPILESKIKSILNNRTLFKKKFIDKSAFIEHDNSLNELDKSFLQKSIELVENNMTDENYTVDTLAFDMAMSRSVFFKKIKVLTGQNPKDFIRDIKMKKAADFIREQKYQISEIAYLIGFPNAKYFSTAFKKYYGTTPTMFLEKEKSEYNNSLNKNLDE